MPGTNKEERSQPRYSVSLHGSLAYRLAVEVLDVGTSGLAVKTTSPLKVSERYSFRFGEKAASRDVRGVVRWCTLQSTHKTSRGDVFLLYEAGIAFDDVLGTDAELLNLLEGKILFHLNQDVGPRRRVRGRFGVIADEPVVAEIGQDLEVLSLSQSGLLIESRLAAEVDSELKVELELGRARFKSSCRVVHIRHLETGETPRLYRVGVEFTDTPSPQLRKLKRFIERELARNDESAGRGTTSL